MRKGLVYLRKYVKLGLCFLVLLSDLASDARSLAGAGPGSGVGSSDLLAEMNDPISGTSTQF